jgi:hypothetical protein
LRGKIISRFIAEPQTEELPGGQMTAEQ